MHDGQKRIMKKQAVSLRNAYIDGRTEKVTLDMPDELPCVEAESSQWLGLYYDNNGKLQSQTLHAKECMTEIYINDDLLNDIYDYLKTAMKNS